MPHRQDELWYSSHPTPLYDCWAVLIWSYCHLPIIYWVNQNKPELHNICATPTSEVFTFDEDCAFALTASCDGKVLRSTARVTLLFRVAVSVYVNSILVNIIKSCISWMMEHFLCVTWPLSRLCVLSTSGQAVFALISHKIFGPFSWFFIHQAVLGGGKNTG